MARGPARPITAPQITKSTAKSRNVSQRQSQPFWRPTRKHTPEGLHLKGYPELGTPFTAPADGGSVGRRAVRFNAAINDGLTPTPEPTAPADAGADGISRYAPPDGVGDGGKGESDSTGDGVAGDAHTRRGAG